MRVQRQIVNLYSPRQAPFYSPHLYSSQKYELCTPRISYRNQANPPIRKQMCENTCSTDNSNVHKENLAE